MQLSITVSKCASLEIINFLNFLKAGFIPKRSSKLTGDYGSESR